MNDKQEFIDFVCNTFDELKQQFLDKQTQYGNADPLANFRKGAMIQYGDAELSSMYEVALQYENKHVAHVYNNGIDGNKIDESLKDVAIYSIIELYLVKRYKK